MKYFAHSYINNNGDIKRQSLKDHLETVSVITSNFASKFDSSEWGEILGRWHDIGKLNPIFQEFITGINPSHNPTTKERAHATLGAIALYRNLPFISLPLVYCIAGHHSGLNDWFNDLETKIADDSIYNIIRNNIFLQHPKGIKECPCKDPKSFHHWIRMLFSCLIDADRLDTERFANPNQSAERGKYDSLEILRDRLDKHLSKFDKCPDTKLNKDRKFILNNCKEKCLLSPGFYSLTVPTGGGKTLSSMAWAINHAIKYKKDRIIIAIPYTSIIAQTAALFRDIFGIKNVLEHHSNISKETEDEINSNNMLRLATENWDLPIIITTNVQLFESLHSNKPSACRKNHNLTNSVIILDEAQMLPVEFLNPVIQSLKTLVQLFHSSVLFTTATQPALTGKIGDRKSQFEGIENVIELIPNPEKLYSDFKRTTLCTFPNQRKFTFEELAQEIIKHNQVLCVVNTRKQAQNLCKFMPEDTIHLSRNMYSEHLMRQIKNIHSKLKSGEAVRVVSTQLIEAGVDIDFPIVYKAFSDLDSIIQAAGRCNREGKLEKAPVYIFEWKEEKPQRFISQGQNVLRDMLYFNNIDELSSPIHINEYFTKMYDNIPNMDKPRTQQLLYENAYQLKFQFKEYASNFILIDDKDKETLLIPLEDGKDIFYKLQTGDNLSLCDYRTLQRFSVTIPKYIADEFRKNGAIEELNGISILSKVFYNKQYGVVSNGDWVEEFTLI